jgi:hypothetical protein
MWLIEKNGVVVGMLRKFKNTRADICPWQLFKRTEGSNPNELLGSFYNDEDVRKIGKAFDGQAGGIVAAKALAERVL